jgi:hypothetical protein
LDRPSSPDDFLVRLGGGDSSGLERATIEPDLSQARIQNSVSALEQHMSGLSAGTLSVEAQQRLLTSSHSGLEKLASEGNSADLTAEERLGLEAIVISDGSRPVLFVQDGTICSNHATLVSWHGKTLTMLAGIRSVVGSVGRIDGPSTDQDFAGTGFVIDPGVLVTNRHVLEAIGDQSPTGWQLKPGVTVDFSHEFERDSANRYQIESVIYAGPHPITDSCVGI